MEQTLKQLGDLLLGAIPTVVLLLTLYGLYHAILHKPLEAVLAERRNRTQGAVEKARADISLAAQRATEYETRLRDARMSIFRSLDQRRKQALEARAEAVAQARERAHQLTAQAKAQIEADSGAARASLSADSERIANQIIGTLLQTVGAGPATIAGGR